MMRVVYTEAAEGQVRVDAFTSPYIPSNDLQANQPYHQASSV